MDAVSDYKPLDLYTNMYMEKPVYTNCFLKPWCHMMINGKPHNHKRLSEKKRNKTNNLRSTENLGHLDIIDHTSTTEYGANFSHI